MLTNNVFNFEQLGPDVSFTILPCLVIQEELLSLNGEEMCTEFL